MNPAGILLLIDGLTSLINLATNAGINFAKLKQMIDDSPDGKLTAEQRQELLDDMDSAVEDII